MSKVYASGLYSLSVLLLIVTSIGFVFSLISLASSVEKERASLSFCGIIAQILVCVLAIIGARTYETGILIAATIICGIVLLYDIALIVIYGILMGILISGSPSVVASAGVAVWIGVVLLLVPIISIMLFAIEFVLLVKHSRLASSPRITGDYVRVTAA
jgi:hypothetical protein